MSSAAYGAKCIFEYLKGNVVFAYGRIILWRSEHPKTAELIDTLIRMILLKLAADIASEIIFKGIKRVIRA